MDKSKNFLPEQLDDLSALYGKFKDFDGYEMNINSFNEFFKNGNRLNYEAEYFSRRACLISRAMMSLIYGGHEEELARIIEAVCGEITWALPAHIGDSETMYDVIDLFSAETGQTLSEICSLCEVSEEVKRKVKSEITRRIIEPYESETFHWEAADHNWAAVCGGCVGMTYMTMFPERFGAVKGRLLKTMDRFLSGYGEDGICLEGADYWSYGFGYFVCFAEMLERFDGTNLLDNGKVRKIAQCRQHLILRKNIVAGFSDCSRETGFNFGMTCFLKKRFGGLIEVPDLKYRRDFDDCYRWAFYYRSFAWGDPEITADKPRLGAEYFPSAEWYIDKRARFSFAAKGGNNDEPHNHNDLGAFIIADDSGQLIADLGAGEYTAGYFGDKRYEYFHTSSLGHSVPIIDGEPQNGGGAVSRTVKGGFAADITDAYKVSGLRNLTRAFTVDENGVTIYDSFSFEEKGHIITERLVSLVEPKIIGGGVKIGELAIRADFAAPRIDRREVTSHHGLPETVYAIDFTVAIDEKKRELTIICSFCEDR